MPIIATLAVLSEEAVPQTQVFGTEQFTGEVLEIDTGLAEIQFAMTQVKSASLKATEAATITTEVSGGKLSMYAWASPGTKTAQPITVFWQVLGLTAKQQALPKS